MAHEIKDPSLVTDADRVLRLSRQVEALQEQLSAADGWRKRADQADALERELERERGRVASLEGTVASQGECVITGERALAAAKRLCREQGAEIERLNRENEQARAAAEKHAAELEVLRGQAARLKGAERELAKARTQIEDLEQRPSAEALQEVIIRAEKAESEAESLRDRPTHEQLERANHRALQTDELRQKAARAERLEDELRKAHRRIAEMAGRRAA